MNGRALLRGAVAAATAWAALTSWRGFVTYPSAYLLVAAALAAVLAVLGGAGPERWPRWTRILAELGACAIAVGWTASGSPVPGRGHSVATRFERAFSALNTFHLPLDRTVPSLTPVLVLGSAIVLFLVQVLAVHLRRPSLAGLALLTVFALPAGFHGWGSTVVPFVVTAAGFLALLVLDGADRQDRWGRHEDARADGSRTVRTAVPTGSAAIALALVAAVVVPLPHDGLFGLTGGDEGPGVTIRRPMIDMRRDLERHADTPLVDVTTDEPDPSYLRVAVLNRFTGLEWSSGDRNVSSEREASGDVPLTPGLSPAVPHTPYAVEVHALPAFDSTWLPTAYPISQIQAGGDWRWDPTTMDFIGAGSTNAAGLTYRMTAERLDYGTSGGYFQDASAGSVPSEDLEVPASMGTEVHDLALQVTARAKDDYERALLLQAFFRVDGGFRYSLSRAPDGAVGETMSTFLSRGPEGRIGYCEQFASAMALMARVVGIPSRVAVGFLQPRRIGPDEYEYTSDDLHAWPELYFSGAGWVPFEPTPATRAAVAPPYSTVPVTGRQGGGEPPVEPSQAPTSATTSGPTASARPSASSSPAVAPAPATQHDHATQGGGVSWGWLLGSIAALLLVGGLAAGPALVRRRLRAVRLLGDAATAWAEIRATALDLALPWPEDRSPREQAAGLVAARARPEAAEALDRVVDAVQQTRYAAPERAVAVAARTDLGAEAAVVVGALEAGAHERARRRARWLPRSLVDRWTR